MKLRIAVAQMTSTEDIEENFLKVKDFSLKAKSDGASLICFPENFAFLAKDSKSRPRIAQPLSGPLFSRYCQLAKELEIEFSYGGFPELNESEQVYNTHVIVSPKGEITATYRKIHLFTVNMPNGPHFDESVSFEPGDKVVVTNSPIANLGLSICFDLRFAELYVALANKGADIFLVPAAFTEKTGSAHWELLLRSRAVENQCYVAAAAQYGLHHPGRATFGHAMIVDPFGTVVAQCSNGEGVVTADFDRSFLNSVRESMPMQRRLHGLT